MWNIWPQGSVKSWLQKFPGHVVWGNLANRNSVVYISQPGGDYGVFPGPHLLHVWGWPLYYAQQVSILPLSEVLCLLTTVQDIHWKKMFLFACLFALFWRLSLPDVTMYRLFWGCSWSGLIHISFHSYKKWYLSAGLCIIIYVHSLLSNVI